jgi:hypothetical protein
MRTEIEVAYKVILGNIKVTVAVIVDIEVIVTRDWQDDVAEEAEVKDMLVLY